jgi:hypothetical protein
MSKNKKLLLLGITLVIAGFFIIIFFSSEEEEYVELDFREKNTFEDPENYEFEELEETTLVTNENLGFSFEVPKDWSVSAYEENGEEFGYVEDPKGITFLSSDYQANENDEIEKGCEILFTIFDYTKDNSEINDLIVLEEEIYEYTKEEKTADNLKKMIEIEDYYGLGYLLNANYEDWQNATTGEAFVRIPIGKMIYNISVIFYVPDIEKCQKEFFNLLNSISFTEKND